jgi:hypothetical protein
LCGSGLARHFYAGSPTKSRTALVLRGTVLRDTVLFGIAPRAITGGTVLVVGRRRALAVDVVSLTEGVTYKNNNDAKARERKSAFH